MSIFSIKLQSYSLQKTHFFYYNKIDLYYAPPYNICGKASAHLYFSWGGAELLKAENISSHQNKKALIPFYHKKYF